MRFCFGLDTQVAGDLAQLQHRTFWSRLTHLIIAKLHGFHERPTYAHGLVRVVCQGLDRRSRSLSMVELSTPPRRLRRNTGPPMAALLLVCHDELVAERLMRPLSVIVLDVL